jgi:predicted nucleotidyltransferase
MFQRLLGKIAKALSTANVPYMIIGGQAVLLYGEPRLTKDIDLTVGVGLESLTKIRNVLLEIHLNPLVEREDFTIQTMVLPCQDSETGIRIDVIFSHSPYEQQALDRVRRINLEGIEVCFAGPEDVVIHKVIAGRPRDLEDVETILLKNLDLNKVYIANWLRDFSEALGEPFLQRFEEIIKRVP